MLGKILGKVQLSYKYVKNHLTEVVLVTGLGCGGGLLIGRWGAVLGVVAGVGFLVLANKIKDKEE